MKRKESGNLLSRSNLVLQFSVYVLLLLSTFTSKSNSLDVEVFDAYNLTDSTVSNSNLYLYPTGNKQNKQTNKQTKQTKQTKTKSRKKKKKNQHKKSTRIKNLT